MKTIKELIEGTPEPPRGYIVPVEAYQCPKGGLVRWGDCKQCQYFEKFDYWRGQYCVVCKLATKQ
jgi:hypothetical protein